MRTLSSFETLKEANEYELKILDDADKLREYLMLIGKWGNVISHTIDPLDDLFNAASGIVYKVNAREPISFDPLTSNGKQHITMLQGFVLMGYLEETEQAAIMSMAITKPLESATLVQFNQAKGVCTEKMVENYNGQDIKITLTDLLPESCMVTTWDKDDVFEPENFGKVAHLKIGVNKYKLKTSNKKADGSLFVSIPLENFNFTVELI